MRVFLTSDVIHLIMVLAVKLTVNRLLPILMEQPVWIEVLGLLSLVLSSAGTWTVLMENNAILCDVTPCILAKVCRRSGRTYAFIFRVEEWVKRG
jgi:hypothetical protein